MFIENSKIGSTVAGLVVVLFLPIAVLAQPLGTMNGPFQKPKIRISAAPAGGFHPTCNLDSNSVGFYFFSPNLGAKWTLRTISQVLDLTNTVLKCDTTYSFERIISDSNRTIQGLPVLLCESSFPYHIGGEDSAKRNVVEYYVDDSVIMTVVNHSITSELDHILLENPLDSGSMWADVSNDTTKTTVIATNEPVSTPMGDFPQALVVQTPAGFGSMSKYFVKGVGIVKIVFRGIPPQQNGTFVVTSELIALDRGNPKRSIKYRFGVSTKKKVTKKKHTILKQ